MGKLWRENGQKSRCDVKINTKMCPYRWMDGCQSDIDLFVRPGECKVSEVNLSFAGRLISIELEVALLYPAFTYFLLEIDTYYCE